MTFIDPHTAVRAAALYAAAAATLFVWAWRRPPAPVWHAAVLASAWNLPVLLAINAVAPAAGWWRFDASGGVLLGVPVDLLLAWTWLWSAVPIAASVNPHVGFVVVIALAADLLLMPLLAPVLWLSDRWLVGEAVALATALVPSLYLARWTRHRQRVRGRALLQVGAFSGLAIFLLPAIAIDGSGGSWINPMDRSRWAATLGLQLLALPAIVGLSAVQEFVERGRGTPAPFDPPERLVITGVYAYLQNPMQTAGVTLLIVLGVFLENVWVAAAGVVAHIYSVGLAGWDEDADLSARFGDAWRTYRANVPRWWPRFRPFVPAERPSARLYVSATCEMCHPLGQWLLRRRPTGLSILPAESHTHVLTRITYEPADGTAASAGIVALARALEHLHVGWAMIGMTLRLPLIAPLVQLLADASGAEPRACRRTTPAHPTIRT